MSMKTFKESKMKVLYSIIAIILVQFVTIASSECVCHAEMKTINSTIMGMVTKDCRKVFEFVYDYSPSEIMPAYVCVSSPFATKHTPIMVVVRQCLGVMSFQVPQVFEDERKSSFNKVCRTLCPLANYFDNKTEAGKQHIFVDLTTRSAVAVEVEVKLSILDDFIIVKNQPLNFNITPSQPRVLQYNMEDDVSIVRIEANSSSEMCMIMSLEDIQCPFTDSELTVESSGFYQTALTKAGISVTKNTFVKGQMYIILVLKTTSHSCTGLQDSELSAELLSKEITITITPTITDYEFALGVPIIPYACVILGVIIYLGFFCLKQRRENSATTFELVPAMNGRTNEDFAVEKQAEIYLSDFTKKPESILRKRSDLYYWNLCIVVLYFGVPTFQLVYLNQNIVNLTGDQDLCYYNFLCSNQASIFYDFNHVYSNIGYIILGFCFIAIAYLRYRFSMLEDTGGKFTGVPEYFGLYYTMGLASVGEGLMSGIYHVCPNRANFQFDTAFMYVLCAMCFLKLYQNRHPDIVSKSHISWLLLALVVSINGGDIILDSQGFKIVYIVVFDILYIIIIFMIHTKIYYMGCENCDKTIAAYIRQHRQFLQYKCACCAKGFKPQFCMFFLSMCLNIVWLIMHITEQSDFSNFFLNSFMMNVGLYAFYYMSMKIYECKKGRNQWSEELTKDICKIWIPIFYLIISLIFWGVAYSFFKDGKAKWELTPARSREANNHCYLLNFYDEHDIWHFTSSFGIFFLYMMLLTLDDNIKNVPWNKIKVF